MLRLSESFVGGSRVRPSRVGRRVWTISAREDEFRRQTHANEGDRDYLQHLDEERDRHGLFPVEAECHCGSCVGSLEETDVSRGHANGEPEIDREQRRDRGTCRDGRMSRECRRLICRDL